MIVALSLFPLLRTFACGKESAWNGQTPSGTDSHQVHSNPITSRQEQKQRFSSSPLIRFVGSRFNSFDNMYVTMTLRWTDEKGAATPPDDVCGTGIEWFGGLDRSHGIAAVFIDGKKVQKIGTCSNIMMSRKQQRIF